MGIPTLGRVRVITSNRTNQQIIRAFSHINPYHKKKGRETVTKWNDLLIGQDLRTETSTNVFGDNFSPEYWLHKWEIELTFQQRHLICKVLRSLPNDLGILQRGAGAGKTLVDLMVASLMFQAGKKVLFVGSVNASINDYAE